MPSSPTVASPPPLHLPYTIHYHQHIHRMKERLAGFKKCFMSKFYHFLLLNLNPLFALVFYFLFISFFGFLVLKKLKIRNPQEKPKDIDMFFTAVSAATVSSMSTVEMEVFTNAQLVVLTILMLLGGEIFTSLLGLYFNKSRFRPNTSLMNQNRSQMVHPGDIELETSTVIASMVFDSMESDMLERDKNMKYTAILYLSYVVLGYLLVIHIGGTVAIMTYIYLVSDARRILREKGLNILTFSIFTTVSSFSNCGFVPTNENMIVFKKNLGLLLIIVPQCLLGGTMYPPALRLALWFLKKITRKQEFDYILRDVKQMGYAHLFPRLYSLMLAFTVFGFLVVQIVAICAMEWSNEEMGGFRVYGKVVNYLFLAVNARHTGESTVDLSTITPAILVLFVFMMYLPPYTTFMPFKDETRITEEEYHTRESKSIFKSALFSQLSFLSIFVMLVCVTERDKLSRDPLNFNVFNIVFEVVSAYGNVGYSIGYSCSRQLATDSTCRDLWTGFVGRWSASGKIVLIVVMFFGRLKRYTMRCGTAWKLSYKK
ncbi:Sodium transporter family protein [Rhynchospora pubera]|uniref:Sodium transporter family protein n=1 Tax=Rhynchospora pubera TaxID=906938 RepID=A0AAV8CJB4_9POAL|nr:Sodium transporter family protein [Rhynchospora pubera]